MDHQAPQVPLVLLAILVPQVPLVVMDLLVLLVFREFLVPRDHRDLWERVVKMEPRDQMETLALRDPGVSPEPLVCQAFQAQRVSQVLMEQPEHKDHRVLLVLGVLPVPLAPRDHQVYVVPQVTTECLDQVVLMESQELQGETECLACLGLWVTEDHQVSLDPLVPLASLVAKESLDLRDLLVFRDPLDPKELMVPKECRVTLVAGGSRERREQWALQVLRV